MDSTYLSLIQHALETSPTQGNGYGLALGFSLFANTVLVGAIIFLVRERTKLAKEYVSYLKRARISTGGK